MIQKHYCFFQAHWFCVVRFLYTLVPRDWDDVTFDLQIRPGAARPCLIHSPGRVLILVFTKHTLDGEGVDVTVVCDLVPISVVQLAASLEPEQYKWYVM